MGAATVGGRVTADSRALGVFGGTFDPIHVAHLAVAEAARDALGLERVLFIPNRQPPHKPDQAVTPAADLGCLALTKCVSSRFSASCG